MKIDRLLNMKEVIKIVGIKKSTLYNLIKKDKFPKPIKIGNLSRWRLSDIQNWINDPLSN